MLITNVFSPVHSGWNHQKQSLRDKAKEDYGFPPTPQLPQAFVHFLSLELWQVENSLKFMASPTPCEGFRVDADGPTGPLEKANEFEDERAETRPGAGWGRAGGGMCWRIW